MASYIIAGKADDLHFARAEYAAKQIEAACPNIFFRYEMKHPDMWQDFINSVFRKYDFDGYSEDFAGPLVWTHEGDLIGSDSHFIQQVCIDKFGIPAPPPITDDKGNLSHVFKEIAKDNMKQVKLQQVREVSGAPFIERCEAAHKRALGAGMFSPTIWAEEKRMVIQGASMEVWVSDSLAAEHMKIREEFGNGESAQVDASLAVTSVGPEQSHTVLLHPRPLVSKHLVLAPRRFIKDIPAAECQPAMLEVPPSAFRNDPEEDLGEADFAAAMEVISSVGGVACWMGLRGGSEYRDPLDSHLQVLPFPVHRQGEDSPLRYPLELTYDRALREGDKTLKVFPFRHSLAAIPHTSSGKGEAADLAKEALRIFEQMRGKPSQNDSFALAFTTSWMCLMPLDPPQLDSAKHETWLRMPPPPPCSLCGIVVCPMVPETYPETAKLPQAEGCKLVSTRAEEEGIPEGTPEFEIANRQVRINSKISDKPIEIMGVWAQYAV
jgi:hypothetical protein